MWGTWTKGCARPAPQSSGGGKISWLFSISSILESVWWAPTQSEPEFGMWTISGSSGVCILHYYSTTIYPAHTFSFSHHQSRPLDVLQCVKEACFRGHLCLTIPWVVQYLSMMDSLALHNEYYKTLLYTLITIYRCVCFFLMYSWCICPQINLFSF